MEWSKGQGDWQGLQTLLQRRQQQPQWRWDRSQQEAAKQCH